MICKTLYKNSFVFIILSLFACNANNVNKKRGPHVQPNFLIILADQWRADAFGYSADPNVHTPNIDKLAAEGINCYNAVSGTPVCSPYRASLLTGQRPLTHGVFMNDVTLNPNSVSIGKVMGQAGYQTGYIGKWHLNGHGRSTFIPPGKNRQGFQYWKVLECTHNYNHSIYYSDTPDTLLWEGYDAIDQTKDAKTYIMNRAVETKPFFLILSWGPPHAPYHTAPQQYIDLYNPDSIQLRPNVPEELHPQVRKDLAGYYAHCTALDDLVGELRLSLYEAGLNENTIILFISDHGDLLGSHGYYKKQQPYDESIRVPMLYYIPESLSGQSARLEALINSEDIMPTLLGLASIDIPKTVVGIDYSEYLMGGENPGDTITLLSCPQPFGQWGRKKGGREYRGLRSLRFTYTRDLNGPWLLFDNIKDPFQMRNLVHEPGYEEMIKSFDKLLERELGETEDDFLPGMDYVKKWGYILGDNETVPYTR